MGLLLCEETLLIALDDDSGRDRSRWGSDAGLAGAVLLDLADRGLLDADADGKLVARGEPGAAGHPLLEDALAEIRDGDKQRSARRWVDRLPRALKPLRGRVADSLVERGILREEHARALGLFARTRFPTADPAPEQELRDRLRAILVEGREPDQHEALLIGLLDPLELIGSLVERSERRAARRRAKQVAELGLAGTAVRDAVRAVQGAVVAAVAVSGAAAASS